MKSVDSKTKQYKKYGTFLTRRLSVNGFVIEFSMVHREVLLKIQSYDCFDLMQIAGIDIRVMNDAGIWLYSYDENSKYDILGNKALKRLISYKLDYIKILFNEEINQKKIQPLSTESKPEIDDNNILYPRIINLAYLMGCGGLNLSS
ncbi:MAG: hypothetical protein WCO29_14370 [Nostocales cyanobacterium ELA583]